MSDFLSTLDRIEMVAVLFFVVLGSAVLMVKALILEIAGIIHLWNKTFATNKQATSFDAKQIGKSLISGKQIQSRLSSRRTMLDLGGTIPVRQRIRLSIRRGKCRNVYFVSTSTPLKENRHAKPDRGHHHART